MVSRAERRTGVREARREEENPVAVVAETELGLAAKHAFTRNTGDRTPFDDHASCGQVGTERREDDKPSRLGHVRRAAHDLLRRSPAVDGDHAQPTAGRVRPRRHDAGDDAGLGPEPECLQAFDLQPGTREARRDAVRVVGELGAELAQPAEGGLHRRADG